jgi:hypothetical protein
MKMSKEVVYRGISVSEQFATARRLSELTVGQQYKFGQHCLEYLGKIGRHHKFRSIHTDIFLRKNQEVVSRYPFMKI